jgi:hypothetical protein
MPNRLAAATSPYLLQHASNPVDWWEWSPEAFYEARRRNVPILLSVGYAACHWCQVALGKLRKWPETTNPQVSGTISVRAGSASFAV